MTQIPSNAASLSQEILSEARSWIGTPYVHQASKKQVGCDCLGLLRGLWRHLYGTEPDHIPGYTADWDLIEGNDVLLQAAHRHLVPISAPQIASVLFFRWAPQAPAKHLAIMSAPRRMIHAYERAGVIESPLGTHWRKRIAGCFVFPPRFNTING